MNSFSKQTNPFVDELTNKRGSNDPGNRNCIVGRVKNEQSRQGILSKEEIGASLNYQSSSIALSWANETKC